MFNLIPTSSLVKEMEYYPTPVTFFENFSDVWDEARFQILKLETKQSYIENENNSWEEWKKGNLAKAKNLILDSKRDDIDLYKSLSLRKVDFIRCRPLLLPLTSYIKWEIENYFINAMYGEKIFFLFREDENEIFNNLALHDFMVFDKQIAFVHNYNDDGKIQGGWVTKKKEFIENLILIFALIKSSSQEINIFIDNNKLLSD